MLRKFFIIFCTLFISFNNIYSMKPSQQIPNKIHRGKIIGLAYYSDDITWPRSPQEKIRLDENSKHSKKNVQEKIVISNNSNK